MFYSVFVLGKKGPLARVWLAAHWDKKITKAQILETNIVESVDSILQPRVKLSLRTSSHLLLGIVRIYARKTLYLLQDCQDAAFKIKSAFRPGAVDLPDGKTEAAISAITLPEMLDFINDFDLIAEAPMAIEPPPTNANLRSITLVEDVSSIHVDDPLTMRDDFLDGGVGAGGDKNSINQNASIDLFDRPPMDDGFGGPLGVGLVDEDMFPMPMPPEAQQDQSQAKESNQLNDTDSNNVVNEANGEEGANERPDSRMSDHSSFSSFGPGASPAPSGPPSTPGSIAPPLDDPMDVENDAGDLLGGPIGDRGANQNREPLPDSMVLEPLEGGVAAGLAPKRKRRKKLGIIIDEVKTLSGEDMKHQLSDTSDIVTSLDLAPPSKKLMHWKKTGGAEKLFALSERVIASTLLQVYYTRHLVTNRIDKEKDMMGEESPPHALGAVNGDLSKHPELEDITQSIMAPISPTGGEDYRPPRTPKTPNYRDLGGGIHRSPAKKKRRVERDSDKENRRAADKANHVSNFADRISTNAAELNESSIQQGREGTGYDASASYYNPRSTATMINDDDDDDHDFAAPMSVGPPEDMLPDETPDQFEERMVNKRTNVLLRFMGNQLDQGGHVMFAHLVKQNRRKQVAQKFFSLLVLKKQHAIELSQNSENPYSEIFITKGVRYEECISAPSM